MIEIPVGVECYLIVKSETIYIDTGYDDVQRIVPKISTFTSKNTWEAEIVKLVVAGNTDFVPLIVKRPEIQTTVAVKIG